MASGGVFYDPYHAYNPMEAALYAGLHRVAWALGTALILLNASYGRALGAATRVFLHWGPWVPLSKLVYGAYLVHMCWQLRFAAMATSPRTAAIFDILLLAFGDIVWSFFLAFILYILVEAPFRRAFRVLISPKPRPPKEENTTGGGTVVVNIPNGPATTQDRPQDSRL